MGLITSRGRSSGRTVAAQASAKARLSSCPPLHRAAVLKVTCVRVCVCVLGQGGGSWPAEAVRYGYGVTHLFLSATRTGAVGPDGLTSIRESRAEIRPSPRKAPASSSPLSPPLSPARASRLE